MKETTPQAVETRAVWRFEITGSETTLMMPIGAQILSSQLHICGQSAGKAHVRIDVYALVNPHAEPEPRTFRVLRTGFELPAAAMAAWKFVFTAGANHVFEIPC